MNKFYLLLIACLLSACTTDREKRQCSEEKYDSSFSIRKGEKICFPDDNTLTLFDVEHAYCRCGFDCDGEGGLFITVSTLDQTGEGEKKFYEYWLHLNPSIMNSHDISLNSYFYNSEDGQVPDCAEDFDAEEITLTITITKK